MADEEHLAILRQGVDAWNAWREKEPSIRPNLVMADLIWANLLQARLNQANLSGADLSEADLCGADLSEADLSEANLHGAKLIEANLYEADLSEADLYEADLSEADLSEANLSGADLSMANLRGANLGEANVRVANLSGAKLDRASLMRANLIDACLDGADLTGAKLWEIQRAGWSIKNVTCRVAFWDREGKEPTKYEEGEFERIFAEKPRIVLHYSGAMSPVDLLALPLIVERLQADHPDSVLQIRSLQNDAGGASVTITVEDVAGRSADEFAVEMEVLRRDLLDMQQRVRGEESLRLAAEAKYQALVHDVLPRILEKVGPTMTQDTYNVSGQAGAVGPGAQARNNTFQQIQAGIDLPKLAEELGRLHAAMKGETTGTREQDKAIVAVADAEEAAAKGDGPAALQYLKSAGKWTLGIAEKISVPVVIEALKRAM